MKHTLQLQKAPPNIWSYANYSDLRIKLPRKRYSWHWGRLLFPKRFLSISPFISNHPFSNSYTRKPFMILFSPFVLCSPGKVRPLITYLGPSQGRGNPTSEGPLDLPCCWWSCSYSPISSVLVYPKLTQPHLCHVRLPNLQDPFKSLSLVNNLKPGEPWDTRWGQPE